MELLLIIGIVVCVLICLNLVGLFKEIFFPDFPINKDRSKLCGNKKCAFYKVEQNEGAIDEKAICIKKIRKFEEKYRGRSACQNSIQYFGMGAVESMSVIKQRRQQLFSSLNALAAYISIILLIYRLSSGG